nr:hypothetical protein [Tanacetum cinerariifolium]
MAKAKENNLNVGIHITSSKSLPNYQEAAIKEPLLADRRVIATKMKKKRLKTKNVLWLKLLMRIYDVVERVMRPLGLSQTCRPRSNHGKACHFVSSTSAHYNRGSSFHQGDDDEDDGASRAGTSSSTTYLKSLGPLNYQQYDVPAFTE